MKKRILSLALVVVMIAIMLSSFTMAYFTDSETVSNVMTLGDVDITITETDHDGNPFDQNSVTVLPSPDSGVIAEGTDLSTIENMVEKGVWVTNTGNTPAYLRTIILFEVPNEGTVAEGEGIDGVSFFDNYVWIYGNSNYRCDFEYPLTTSVTIDGTEYGVLVRTYDEVVAVDDKYEAIVGFTFDKKVTSAEADAMGETYDVLVLAQGVQAEGFDSADEAFEASFGDVTAAKVVEWFK